VLFFPSQTLHIIVMTNVKETCPVMGGRNSRTHFSNSQVLKLRSPTSFYN